jgi:uroporphyrin-III C-methyltransferase/precorrin-2 dehydrogenase/sirohydrochlorin ferrochelatase
MESQLEEASLAGDEPPAGEVYLVGTGPGDPDLLTFRALRLMQQTDVVLYDRLIGDGILNLVRRDAERIYVGKLKDNHTVPQEEIGEMLIDLARQGKRVLRLKGGDPFMFGRGGEEIEALSENGIAFQVIPGVTAANGCAAYAGIPLTHRDHAQACVFVTGHEKDGELKLNWKSLIQPRQTVVLYMGLSSLGAITSGFLENGADPATPAAVIENGTRAGQRVITGTLESLLGKTTRAEVKSPAMIIIGSVVTLRDKLSWFANKP